MTTDQTGTGIPHGRLGMWLFLASEAMLFGSFISAYIVLRFGAGYFPVPPRAALGVPLAALNTLLLLSGSAAMVFALKAARRGDETSLLRSLSASFVLGLAFLGIKSYEYIRKVREGITISGSLYGSFYYALTGLHALHLFAGLVFIAYLIVRVRSPEARARVEYAALYWHFVDLVWLILFPLLYLL